MSEQAARAARHRWTLFGLHWEYEPRLPRRARWGVNDGMRGVGRQAHPVSAYLALRRWRRVPARPQ